MDTISRVEAAACITAARTAVFAQADVHTPPRSAAEWAFARLYDALAENLTASGRDNVSVTYRHLAVLASNRGKGKKTKASSLRKPFSENVWHGSLLENPYEHGGVSLDVRLSPAGKRGRPLILSASFKIRGVPALIEAGNPNGNQPIIEEARLAEERETRLAHQAGVARRFIDTLRDTGFESADDLSRWFARRGIHIAPSMIIAILVIVLCAASAGAVALIRYIVVHNTSRLTTNPSEQGSLPPDHRTRGTLVRIEQLKSGARMETRVAPGTIIWTLFTNDLPYTRRYPDSNLNYEWTITIDGRRTVKKTTTIPEVEYPDEGVTYTVSVQPVELRRYEGLLRKPHVGEYRVDKEEDRGWISGAACVWPRSGYAPRRSSPIDAAVLPGSRVRFLIRHGPAKAGDAILKFSFGDGTVWSSAEDPWTVSEAKGDTWDRYQTTLEHVYSRPGHYDIRFALFRDVGKGLECLREATGQVYVDMPPPSTVPVAPRSPFPGYSFFVPPPGTTSAEDGLKVKYDPQTEPGSEFFFKFEGDNKSFAPAPQVEAVSVRNDPYFVALGVVPPPGIIPWSTYCAHVDFGVDNSPSAPLPDDAQQLGAQTMAIFNYKRGTALVGVQEFLRSGVYPITITAHPTSSRNEFLVVLRRKLHVSANAPPRVTQ